MDETIGHTTARELAAIGYPVSDNDKQHWFLCGLGFAFEGFSTAQRAVLPYPPFRDLLAYAENHEIFLQTLNGTQPPHAAFSAHSHKQNGSFFGRGRSTALRRTPHCQLCSKEGHYANACPNLATYAQRATHLDANLAQAFLAQCNIAQTTPDWTADSGSTTHMLRTPASLEGPFADPGNTFVTFGNGQSLPVTHIGKTKINNDLPLQNVIDQKTATVLARGTCENGFYVLSQGQKSLVAAL
ncbi:uncharacterized protein LOC143632160 [Bidens hawaiensis]|uniref:uncharacterized protein LOC143632160 n=1 Tax=Bidens hawaiensis TaxID=980011 RepID=UPI004049A556